MWIIVKLYGAYDNGSGWTFFSGASGTKSENTNLDLLLEYHILENMVI